MVTVVGKTVGVIRPNTNVVFVPIPARSAAANVLQKQLEDLKLLVIRPSAPSPEDLVERTIYLQQTDLSSWSIPDQSVPPPGGGSPICIICGVKRKSDFAPDPACVRCGKCYVDSFFK